MDGLEFEEPYEEQPGIFSQLLTYLWKRVPEYTAFTFEEHNDYVQEDIRYRRAPEKPRQSDPRISNDLYGKGNRAVRPARMPIALYYQLPLGKNNLQSHGSMTGFHMEVSPNKSWTQSPRGVIRTQHPQKRPMGRKGPSSYGAQIDEIG